MTLYLYAWALWTWALSCNQLYIEYTLSGIFLEELTDFIRSSMV